MAHEETTSMNKYHTMNPRIEELARIMHAHLYKNNPSWDHDTMVNKEWLIDLAIKILQFQSGQKLV